MDDAPAMTAPDAPPDARLKEGALHIAYELSMLHVSTMKAVASSADADGLPTASTISTSASFTSSFTVDEGFRAAVDKEFLHNLYVEGVLLHARNISEFLFPRGGRRNREDDIVATDYEDGWNLDPNGQTIAGEPLSDLRGRIDKHLSHLTYERVDDPDRTWAVAVSRDLLAAFAQFYERLSDERRPWFGPGVAHFFS